ncbi:uncharacterized protein [Temnothorax nylanderi]|uniref:uncharacterized protein n=1 Tax=Temnothorax nylanderi TaxID=102681 RepID=UPI003A88E74C
MGQANITLSAVETRIRLLDDHWAKFESQHDLVRACYKDRYAESEYAKLDLLDQAESAYVLQRSILSEQAKLFKAASASASVTASDQGGEHAPRVSLPRINLPQFSGAYEDWPSFRDLFRSVIGDKPAIPPVERLHYLRSCLKGPAEKLIRSLTITGENYDRAWALLCQHYENKRELIRSNFATFTAVAKMKAATADELSRVHNAATSAVNAQESIGRPIASHGMDLFNHLVIELFDSRTRLEWESSSGDSFEPPSHDTLMSFISKRILTLNAANPKNTTKPASEPSRSAKTHVAKRSEPSQCPLCKGKHSLMGCPDFKAKTASERKTVVETNKLCYNCLGNHLVVKCQSTRNCFTCNLRHHSMLHDAYVSTPKPAAEVSALSAAGKTEDRKAILLATARVTIADRHGDPHEVRALIDQGSEVSIVSESLVQRLRLPRSRTRVSIFGIGGSHSGSTRGKVSLNVTSRTTGDSFTAVAFVLPRLSLYQGSTNKCSTTWPHLQGLPLADPRFTANDPVELLLGAEVCSTILEDGLRRGEPQTPIAQKTILGWILSGGCGATSLVGHLSSFQGTADRDLAELVRRFWEQESEPPASVTLTPEEEECEQHFVRTHERTPSGRYVVRLPFASPPKNLVETRKPAERLLTAMERRCARDPRFGELYHAFMREYEDLGHMEAVAPSDENLPRGACYLPHHGVLKEASTTTKLRVVFNGSQRTSSGESLNDHLFAGANLLPALADVLLRWRRHRYVMITDIEKMYRQISVHPEDRDHQRILWRSAVDLLVRVLRLTTVTYGLKCSPWVAIRTLLQLAADERSRYPRGAIALEEDRYMDDVVTGEDTIDDAIAVQTELRELCTAGGFPLRKWAANSEDILVGIPREHRLQRALHVWENDTHSTLGLRWHPTDDEFSFAIRTRAITEFTKRRVLSETARLFDPLGWLTPVVIRAKIFIQSAWLKRLEWDSPLPSADAQLWARFLGELPLLEGLRVSRWLNCGATESQVEIHGFADASERGYAAAVYLRVTRGGSTTLHLLVAKSKVAPIQQVSLARLELSAAALLTKLTRHARDTLHLPAAPIFLWSDARVTLHWIKGHASRWKTFVANRVSLIQRTLPEARWRHVPGRDNPADCASRGIAPGELIGHPLWWTGPAWLREDRTRWPDENDEIPDAEMPERKAVVSAVGRLETEPDTLLRFSSLHRLLRVTAWCLRWRRTTSRTDDPRPDDRARTLTPEELDTALFRWQRVVQSLHYPEEIKAVRDGRTVSHRSPLAKLSPFLDDNGVLRVGGRLKHALLPHDARHPLIAPTSSWLTRLLVESCHRRTLHGGVQLTLGTLRLRHWIPRGRAVVKQLLHRCVICTRWRAAPPQPPMGSLPRARVIPSRPFQRTGVDYAGPILIRTTKGRGHRAHKAFIAVFVCLVSKAVHLEVVSDYTTEAFLAALRRFTARRGLCTDIYSDCGTNFIGADRALQDLLRASSSDGRRIAHDVSTHGIRWHFNPPAAPHFGGLWEAAVKSTKFHLRRVIGETTLTFEEMATFLAQVEACLNSRPLQALSDDPDDVTALTPGHFLIGAPLLAAPEPSLGERPDNTLTRWQLVQKMRDHFWQRWSRECIQHLASRPKWLSAETTPDVGSLCLMRSEIAPPNRWPLARIIKLHPGDDGVVRVVTVRTAASEFVRPLVKLVLLPGAAGSTTTVADA